MNRSIFSLLLLFICCSNITAQEHSFEEPVTTNKPRHGSFIPAYCKIHYAGSMGLLSVGTGWGYGKNQWGETDIIVGFVPKYSSNKAKLVFTVKQNFIPWNAPLGKKGFSFDPLTCGLYINTVSGREFWVRTPDHYPKNYYNIFTKIHFNIFIGERFTYKIPEEKKCFIKSISLFYELSTNELYIISAVANKYLKPSDYLGLSLGLKFQFL